MALLMPPCFLLAQQIPYNPLELLRDTTQLAKLLGSAPADDAAVLFRRAEHRHGLVALWPGSGRIYAFDIMGAGAGSVGVIGIWFSCRPSNSCSS